MTDEGKLTEPGGDADTESRRRAAQLFREMARHLDDGRTPPLALRVEVVDVLATMLSPEGMTVGTVGSPAMVAPRRACKGIIARYMHPKRRKPTALQMGKVPLSGKHNDLFRSCVLYEVARKTRLNKGVTMGVIAENLGEHFGVVAKAIKTRAHQSKPTAAMEAARRFLRAGEKDERHRRRIREWERLAAAGYVHLPDLLKDRFR